MFKFVPKGISSLYHIPKNLRSQLKQRLHDVLPKKIEQFRDIRRKYGEYEIGALTVNEVINGCVNSPILFHEPSVMDTKTVDFLINFFIISFLILFFILFH